MESVLPLVVRQLGMLWTGESEVTRLDDEQFVFVAEAERGDVDRRLIASMGVPYQESTNAGVRHGGAELDDGLGQKLGLQT